MSWETLVRMKGNAREIFGVSLALQLEDVGIMLATMTASTEFATCRQRRFASGPLVEGF